VGGVLRDEGSFGTGEVRCYIRNKTELLRIKKERPMLEIIPDMPENVLAVRASGRVTGEDYDKVLIPALDGKLKENKKIRLFYHIVARDLSGFAAEAMWDDAKVGIRHLSAFEKIAVVSDVTWIIGAVKIFAVVIPCPVKVFGNEKLQEAKAWVSQ
jgi:hypothetical protein